MNKLTLNEAIDTLTALIKVYEKCEDAGKIHQDYLSERCKEALKMALSSMIKEDISNEIGMN